MSYRTNMKQLSFVLAFVLFIHPLIFSQRAAPELVRIVYADALATGWQDSINNSQPTFYVDEIALVSPEDPNGPLLANGELLPRAIPADGISTLVVRLQVSDPQGGSDTETVSLDASSLGRGIVQLHDDGRSFDAEPNDGLYSAVLTIAPGTHAGERALLVSAADQTGHQAGLLLGVLSVLDSPGGLSPGELPQRIGWGSNCRPGCRFRSAPLVG